MWGTTTCGTPARNAAAVVPAPPWWTTPATRPNSQSCGTSSSTSTPGGRADGVEARPSPRAAPPARPPRARPRGPAPTSRRDRPPVMLPNPIATGAGPSARNASSAGGGVQSARLVAGTSSRSRGRSGASRRVAASRAGSRRGASASGAAGPGARPPSASRSPSVAPEPVDGLAVEAPRERLEDQPPEPRVDPGSPATGAARPTSPARRASGASSAGAGARRPGSRGARRSPARRRPR